ncbi:MAG: NUDIX hydrolase [Gammaproteobacteria bacterium]|nr:MAG: NUDIX hydrolase [Gammaproteobacteria bacterium]
MKNRKSLYKGEVVDLGLERVTLPNQQTMQLEVVRHPGGSAVVALDNDNRVCLLRQYRHAAGGWLWELPAGKIDSPESPQHTAQRELQEEAGLTAKDWLMLGSFLSTPGFCDERIYLYLARNLTNTRTDHHPHEVIEVHWIEFQQTLEWVHNGEIVDGKTMLGLLITERETR